MGNVCVCCSHPKSVDISFTFVLQKNKKPFTFWLEHKTPFLFYLFFYFLFALCSSRSRMYSFPGTMHIGSLSRMRRDSRLRGMHHLFPLISPPLKIHLMCWTNGSIQLPVVLFILSAKRWKHIGFTRLFSLILFLSPVIIICITVWVFFFILLKRILKS